MYEQEWLDESELRDCIVCLSRRLGALIAKDTHAHIGLKNHHDIIGSVSNRKSFQRANFADVFIHLHDYVGLLSRRQPARNHHFDLFNQRVEDGTQLIGLLDCS